MQEQILERTAIPYRKKVERKLFRLEEREDLPDKDKHLITKFLNEHSELSPARQDRYLDVLVNFSKHLGKGFQAVKKDDIVKLVNWLDRNTKYKEYTKYTYKAMLKRFYKWLRGRDEEYPPEVKWIKNKTGLMNNILPEYLLDENEIRSLIEAAEHPRDKALISCLYDGGVRISELLTLQIKNVHFDKYGAFVIVRGKTGDRRVRLVLATPYLTTWLNNHPFRDQPEQPLWICVGKRARYARITYSATRSLLIRVAGKVGIKKRVNPHSFRHARATFLAQHLTEAQMSAALGWTQGTRMARTYIHLAGRDIDKALLQANGIDVGENEKEASKLAPRKCVRCENINAPTDKFCGRCAAPLSREAILEIEDMEKKKDIQKIEELARMLRLLKTGERIDDKKAYRIIADKMVELV